MNLSKCHTEAARRRRREILQCVAGLVGLAVLVVLYTWLAPGWWAAM